MYIFLKKKRSSAILIIRVRMAGVLTKLSDTTLMPALNTICMLTTAINSLRDITPSLVLSPTSHHASASVQTFLDVCHAEAV